MSATASAPPIHTSERANYKRCRLRWYFSAERHLGFQPRKSHPALSFGTAVHAGWAEYYGGERNIADAIGAAHNTIQEWFLALDNPTEDQEQEYHDSYELAVGMLEHYGEWAPKQDEGFTVEWVERTFDVELPGVEGALYSFTPDGLAKDRFGRYWIMEHKTDKIIPDNTEYLSMDEQCGAYIYALEIATGIRAEGVMYTIARKKVPTPMRTLKDGLLSVDKRVDTTFDYAVRQIVDYHGDGAPAFKEHYSELLAHLQGKGNTFFLREYVRRNPNEIATLGEKLAIEAREMLDPSIGIYRNPTRFNCSSCPFVAPCLSYYEKGDYMTILDGNYVRQT